MEGKSSGTLGSNDFYADVKTYVDSAYQGQVNGRYSDPAKQGNFIDREITAVATGKSTLKDLHKMVSGDTYNDFANQQTYEHKNI